MLQDSRVKNWTKSFCFRWRFNCKDILRRIQPSGRKIQMGSSKEPHIYWRQKHKFQLCEYFGSLSYVLLLYHIFVSRNVNANPINIIVSVCAHWKPAHKFIFSLIGLLSPSQDFPILSLQPELCEHLFEIGHTFLHELSPCWPFESS